MPSNHRPREQHCPRVARVSISEIYVPDRSQAKVAKFLKAPLNLDPKSALVAVLLRPPILMETRSEPQKYVAVGNLGTLMWQVQIAQTGRARDPVVTAVILPDAAAPPKRYIPTIQRYLVPLVQGEFSVRRAGTARRRLREAHITSLKPITAERALQRMTQTKGPTS